MASVGCHAAAVPFGSCGANGASTSVPKSGLPPSHPEGVLPGPSGRADFFFRAWSASTRSANPLGGPGSAALQLTLATGNRVGIQAGDLCEVGDSPRTVLLGEEADEEPSRAFVGGSNEAVDPAMLPGPSTVRMLLAGRASASMDDTRAMLLGHRTQPFEGVIFTPLHAWPRSAPLPHE